MDIFLSYSWSCHDFADCLEKQLAVEPSFHLLRDVNDLRKVESIHSFMSNIRNAFCSILLLNDDYFQSRNCIYELVSLSKEQTFTSKVIPIVWKNTRLFSDEAKADIVEFWTNQRLNAQSLEPSQLANALAIISDLCCIIYDPDDINDAIRCSKSAFSVLYQRMFAMEFRPGKVAVSNITLPDKPLLCIDFGTSYTLASVMGSDGQTFLIPDCRGAVSLPSKIDIYRDGSYAVGNTAQTLISNPITYSVRNLKRALFQRDSYNFGSNKFSTVLLLALILNSVKRNAEEFLNQNFKDVLLSIPVDFRGREIQKLEQAAQLAGLHVLRILQESSTASLLVAALGATTEEYFFLNVDFGGGTLDVSGVESGDGVCEVLFSLGDRVLGGCDYDEAICRHTIKKLEREYGIYPILPDTQLYSQILVQAEQVKIKLSQYESTQFFLECPDNKGNIMDYTWEITRAEFTAITQLLTKRIKEILVHAKELMSLHLKCFQLTEASIPIYLTGQGSKLFSVSQIIREVFPNSEIIDCYQENAVCLGLSQQGGILTGIKKGLLLLDNLHIYVDIQCSSYDEVNDIIHIGLKNEMFYNILDPNKGEYNSPSITIPAYKSMKVVFDSLPSTNDKYEISFFNFNPADNFRTLCFSTTVLPEIKQGVYILEVGVGVGGMIDSATIYTMNEYKKHTDHISDKVSILTDLYRFN